MSVYQNSKFPVRNKSSDKLTHSPFGHNNYPMYPPKNYIANKTKNITPRIVLGKLPNEESIYGYAAGTYGLYAENVLLKGSLVT